GDLALVDLNKPPHNLLDGAMLDALDGAFEDAVNGGCRAIVVASRLRHFCAGADLEAMRSGQLAKLDFIGFLHRMEDLPVPTAGPTVAYRAVKQIANLTAAGGVAAGDALTGEVAPSVWESDDLEAGLRVFLETGSPRAVFTGG